MPQDFINERCFEFEAPNTRHSDKHPGDVSFTLCTDGTLDVSVDQGSHTNEDRDGYPTSRWAAVSIPKDRVPDFLVALQTWIEQL